MYEWNVYTGKRDGESVLKSCSYTGVAVSPDGRTTYAVGSDKTLKEICDSQVRVELRIYKVVFHFSRIIMYVRFCNNIVFRTVACQSEKWKRSECNLASYSVYLFKSFPHFSLEHICPILFSVFEIHVLTY